MTASDRNKTVILVLLVMVMVGLWWWMYGPVATTATNTAATPAAKKAANLTTPQEAQIRTDWIVDTSSNVVGRRNLFAYRPKPAPPKPPAPVYDVIPAPVTPQIVSRPPVVQPGPAPFRSFRYDGFSVNRSGKLLGSVSEGGNTFIVSEGECIMGTYCVVRLTETQVEIEDRDLKRKQTFTRTQP